MSTSRTLPARVRLASSVAVRPESFGALIYDYDTRRLSFLKDRRLAHIVQTLGDHDSSDAALVACGVTPLERDTYVQAVHQLISMGVLAVEESE